MQILEFFSCHAFAALKGKKNKEAYQERVNMGNTRLRCLVDTGVVICNMWRKPKSRSEKDHPTSSSVRLVHRRKEAVLLVHDHFIVKPCTFGTIWSGTSASRIVCYSGLKLGATYDCCSQKFSRSEMIVWGRNEGAASSIDEEDLCTFVRSRQLFSVFYPPTHPFSFVLLLVLGFGGIGDKRRPSINSDKRSLKSLLRTRAIREGKALFPTGFHIVICIAVSYWFRDIAAITLEYDFTSACCFISPW